MAPEMSSVAAAPSADPMTWKPDEMAAGTLKFDPAAVEKLYGVLDRHVGELRELQERVQQLGRIKGLESLQSSKALQDKFNAKATGDTYYSAQRMLHDRIEIVTKMRDTIKETALKFHQSDQANADQLAKFFGGKE
ncbi:hypothetical protein G4X40_14155 [Rhodococcus sp. D2-41]|uniref:Uncharacterized protein n=1 Tax=Speluncibacter jeojiensis TaxID=2710754 RepID=A0A9X4M2X9_9ACTN|nr:hypothetical protein [Rhodococcus sp. D2-41]MDG3011295.1 hypothetical protein [Rhodococcus sp. D2-41]MDG3015854.1 hypothetical protein [Corynebacteriales bacterium D3-21]